jgi:phytanoyl-CoA hydroxylase
MGHALTPSQVSAFVKEGYLCLLGFISNDELDRLDSSKNRFIEESRTLASSSASILVEPGHTPENPRLRRIPQTGAFDPDFEEFGLCGPIVDIAEDLLAHTQSLQDQLDLEAEIQPALLMTDDFAEGQRAFIEKRKPVFKGR